MSTERQIKNYDFKNATHDEETKIRSCGGFDPTCRLALRLVGIPLHIRSHYKDSCPEGEENECPDSLSCQVIVSFASFIDKLTITGTCKKKQEINQS